MISSVIRNEITTEPHHIGIPKAEKEEVERDQKCQKAEAQHSPDDIQRHASGALRKPKPVTRSAARGSRDSACRGGRRHTVLHPGRQQANHAKRLFLDNFRAVLRHHSGQLCSKLPGLHMFRNLQGLRHHHGDGNDKHDDHNRPKHSQQSCNGGHATERKPVVFINV